MAALANVLFEEGLTDPGERIAALCDGLDELRGAGGAVHPRGGAPAEPALAPPRSAGSRASWRPPRRAAVYGRIGTCTQEFGTAASWLVDVLNVLTGNLDRPGGAMFPLAAAGASNAAGEPGRGRGTRFGRFHSRVRGMGEVFGELPAACLAEEIDTPGEGQIRALITISGNPAVSTPNSARLEAGLRELDFMVSLDVYLNETTRHADVILPAPSPLRRSHYDLGLYQFAVRNVANYSPPALEPQPELPDEWVTMLRLTGVLAGLGADADVAALDEMVARTLLQRELDTATSPVAGRDADELMAALAPRVGPERLLDLMLRVGPYGDGFANRNGDGRPGTGSAWRRSSGRHTGSTSARCNPACPTRCGRPAARSS